MTKTLPREPITDFASYGIRAFTTTRQAGTFSTSSDEPTAVVMGRWSALQAELATGGSRFATSAQVHGNRIIRHRTGWEGWLRVPGTDGHASATRGTGMAVSIADCVPVFIAHPSGATALLHSGWRGTAAGIVARGIAELAEMACAPAELLLHLGPAICGRCYEVSPDVYAQLTGQRVNRPTNVDLRALICDQARAAGAATISVSPFCTRCDNDRFFSHRAGDAGRQLAAMIADS